MKQNNDMLTGAWKEYQLGKDYLSSKGYYEQLNKNYNFFNEDQWNGLEASDMPMPMDNFITPICNYKIGTVSQNNFKIVFSPDNLSVLETTSELGIPFKELAQKKIDVLNKSVNIFWENNNLDSMQREYVERKCVDGSILMYIYKDNDKEIAEMVYAENVCVSDENEDNIQNQEYILIKFRRPVEQIRREATEFGMDKEQIKNIVADIDTDTQIANKDEVQTKDGKANCILKLYKKDGKVHMCKSTQNVMYIPETNLGLTLYPIATDIWIKQKNNARGKSEVEGKISNQIEANKTLSRRSIAIVLSAFSKVVYDERVVNPGALNKVGVAIGLSGKGTTDIRQSIDYLRPVQQSPDAKIYNDELAQKTKENANASDSALGNIDPTKASGRSIIATRDASVVPINVHIARTKSFYEQLAKILFDFWQNTSVDGKKVVLERVDEETGETEEYIEELSHGFLQKLKVSIKVEVTPTDPYSKYAQEQMWTDLFINGKIGLDEWVGGLPDDARTNKSKLENIIKQRKEKEAKYMTIEQDTEDKMSMLQGLQEQEVQNTEYSQLEQDTLQKQEQLQEMLGGDTSELQQLQDDRNVGYD